MDDDEIRKVCIRLVSEAWPVILTTVDRDGFPQTRAMYNLRNAEKYPRLISFFSEQDDDFFVIFSTNTSSTKVENIATSSKASAYYCLPDESRGVMLGGTLEIVPGNTMKKAIWEDGMERYYPTGYDDPDHTVLRLHAKVARGWNQNRTFLIKLGD